MFKREELSDIIGKTSQKARGVLDTVSKSVKNKYMEVTIALQEALYNPSIRLKNATTLSTVALALLGASYYASPVKAESVDSLFHTDESLVAGEKCAWLGSNIGLLAEAGTYSDNALARGIRTEGYSFVRTEAQCKYWLVRINLTDFPGTGDKGFDTKELFAGLRLETEPFSGNIGVNWQEVPEFAGSGKRIKNTEYQAAGSLKLGPWFLDGVLIHDPEGPDIYRQGDYAIFKTGFSHDLFKSTDVAYGIAVTDLKDAFGGLTGTTKEIFAAIKQKLPGGFYITLAGSNGTGFGGRYSNVLEEKSSGYLGLIIGWNGTHMDPKRTRPRL